MASVTKEQEKARCHAYYLAHRDEIKARTREWAKTHREHVSEWQRAYRAAHQDEIISYRQTHREEDKEYCRKWRAANPSKKAELDKAWYEASKKDGVCAWCGNKTKVHDKFCSHKCYLAWNHGENNSNWKGGISYEPYCPKFNKGLKERIRAFFEYRCILCGKTQSNERRSLSCHHVEYNKSACCDGKPVHFAALCISCHGKTSNGDRQRWENMIHVIIEEVYNGRSYFTKEEFEAI